MTKSPGQAGGRKPERRRADGDDALFSRVRFSGDASVRARRRDDASRGSARDAGRRGATGARGGGAHRARVAGKTHRDDARRARGGHHANGRSATRGALSAALCTAAALSSDARATRSRVGSRRRARARETARGSDTGRDWRVVRLSERASSRERASRVWRALDERVERRRGRETARARAFPGFGGAPRRIEVEVSTRLFSELPELFARRARRRRRQSAARGCLAVGSRRPLERGRAIAARRGATGDAASVFASERISARPPRQNSRLAGGSRRTSRWRTPSRP